MTSLLLTDATVYLQDDLNQIVREQIAQPYRQSDNLRTAVMYCPLAMSAGEFAKACEANGIRANTARNRHSEVRRWQRELGEIAA